MNINKSNKYRTNNPYVFLSAINKSSKLQQESLILSNDERDKFVTLLESAPNPIN